MMSYKLNAVLSEINSAYTLCGLHVLWSTSNTYIKPDRYRYTYTFPPNSSIQVKFCCCCCFLSGVQSVMCNIDILSIEWNFSKRTKSIFNLLKVSKSWLVQWTQWPIYSCSVQQSLLFVFISLIVTCRKILSQKYTTSHHTYPMHVHVAS